MRLPATTFVWLLLLAPAGCLLRWSAVTYVCGASIFCCLRPSRCCCLRPLSVVCACLRFRLLLLPTARFYLRPSAAPHMYARHRVRPPFRLPPSDTFCVRPLLMRDCSCWGMLPPSAACVCPLLPTCGVHLFAAACVPLAAAAYVRSLLCVFARVYHCCLYAAFAYVRPLLHASTPISACVPPAVYVRLILSASVRY